MKSFSLLLLFCLLAVAALATTDPKTVDVSSDSSPKEPDAKIVTQPDASNDDDSKTMDVSSDSDPNAVTDVSSDSNADLKTVDSEPTTPDQMRFCGRCLGCLVRFGHHSHCVTNTNRNHCNSLRLPSLWCGIRKPRICRRLRCNDCIVTIFNRFGNRVQRCVPRGARRCLRQGHFYCGWWHTMEQ